MIVTTMPQIEAREPALNKLQEKAAGPGANAVVGPDPDYEVINTMLTVSATDTAVRLSDTP